MKVFKVLISGEIHPDALKLFEGAKTSEVAFEVSYLPKISRAELLKKIEEYQCVMIRTSSQVDKELIARALQLKLVCRIGVGVDNVDISACTQKNIRVANSPVGNRNSTAEHTLGLIFALARNTILLNESLHQGEWRRDLGLEISGKVLGIFGLGNIGRVVAKKSQALGMNVLASDPYVDPKLAKKMDVPLLPLKELLDQSDFVTLHLPLTEETRSLAATEFFEQMKEKSFFINTSRGGVVDEQALERALEKKLSGAALDVFAAEPLGSDHPFLKNKKIILTPHIAGQTVEAALNMSLEAAHEVIGFFKTGVLANPLN